MCNICQQKDILGIEIDGLCKLMRKNPKRKYRKNKNTINNKVQLTKGDYIIQICGKQQHKILDLRKAQIEDHEHESMKFLNLGYMM